MKKGNFPETVLESSEKNFPEQFLGKVFSTLLTPELLVIFLLIFQLYSVLLRLINKRKE
jgi:hypothetical protein